MNKNGFIALTSAVIISAILLVVTAAASITGFYTRANILDTELKERSGALADACADTILLRLAADSTYAGGQSVAVGSDSCHIFAAENPDGNPRVFVVQGIFRNAYTSVRISADVNTLALQSWQEISAYP